MSAWAAAEKISARTTEPAADWQSLGASSKGVVLAAVLPGRDAPGAASIGVRTELFEAQADGVISRMNLFKVDCLKTTIRQTAALGFTQRNLTGKRLEERFIESAQPVEAYEILSGIVQRACVMEAASLILGRDDGPDYRDPRAMRAWMQANAITQQGGAGQFTWLQLGFTPEGVILANRQLTDVNQVSRTTPRVIFRLERFAPVSLRGRTGGTTLSQTMEYDVNCITNVVRQARITQFEGRNLTGRPRTVDIEDPQWMPKASIQMLKSTFDDICRAVG